MLVLLVHSVVFLIYAWVRSTTYGQWENAHALHLQTLGIVVIGAIAYAIYDYYLHRVATVSSQRKRKRNRAK